LDHKTTQSSSKTNDKHNDQRPFSFQHHHHHHHFFEESATF